MFQEPLKMELERLQKQQIIVSLGVDKIWYNSFILVPSVIGEVKLCLDPARLNKGLIRSVHRSPTLNDILLRLADIKCLTLIDASSGYHNLRLDKRYLTMFSFPFGRYIYIRLLFRAVPVGGIFQKKIDEVFSSMSNVFGIAADCRLSLAGQRSQLHILLVCRQVNLKLKKLGVFSDILAFPSLVR